jgi:hypothetical protein
MLIKRIFSYCSVDLPPAVRAKKNVDGRSTSSHDSKKFRTILMEKQGGMAFGFRKTATAVIKPDI